MKTIYLILGLLYINSVNAQDFIPDTAVNQIRLLDASSVRQKLKADTSKINLLFASRDSTIPEIELVNANGTQTLTMVFYPGSSTYEFSVFKIRYSDHAVDDRWMIRLSDKELKTEKGINLGTSRNDVVKKMGKPTLVLVGDGANIETIVYRTTDKNSNILKRYKQVVYYDNYKLKDGKVTEIEFGFVYP